MSSVTLALLTALFAVTGSVGPTIKKLFEVDDSIITAVVVTADDKEMSLLVRNTGTRIGLITAAVVGVPFRVSSNAGVQNYSVFVTKFVPPEALDYPVKPQATESVRLNFRQTQASEYEFWKLMMIIKSDPKVFEATYPRSEKHKAGDQERADCTLALATVTGAGAVGRNSYQFNCTRLRPLFEAMSKQAIHISTTPPPADLK